MITFDKIVKKMLRMCGKVMFKNDIFEIIDPEKKEEYSSITNKIIYRLKSENIIIPLKNGVYIIPDDSDKKLNEIDLIEKYYFKLLKKYITENCGNDYFISGKKSLEFHLKNFGVPEKIFITNRKINKKVLVGNYTIIFKTISGNDEKKINLYSKLSSFNSKIDIDGINFKISNLELSLLETATIGDNLEGIDVDLLNKTIKKYSKFFNKEYFYTIGKYKYITAINRLKELSKNIDNNLYLVFLDIIKKNGGLFVGEGLRKM